MTQERRTDDAPTTYQTIVGPNGVHRIERTDGQPLGPARLPAPLPEPVPDPEPVPVVVDPAVYAARVAAFKADVLARAPALRTGPKGGTLPDPEKHPWKTNGAELPGEAVPEPDALKARREALGVTQREFAGLLGLTRGSWAAVETGTRPGIGHRRHAHSVLARLEDGTLQVQADPRAESVRQRVAALKAQYAAHRASLVGELKAAWDALPPAARSAEEAE